MIARNSEGELLKLYAGVIPHLTPLQNQLWSMLHGLIRGFEDNYRDIILETDIREAFNVINNFPFDVPVEAIVPATQIFIRLHDPRRSCSIVYVFPERNQPAIYLVRLGGEKCDHLYTFSRPIGQVEELLSLDLGFGPLAPQFHDIEIYNDEADQANVGLANVDGVMNGGHAFKEDFFAVYNEQTDVPKVVDINNVLSEDFVFGNGYAEGFAGDHPMSVMFN